MTKSAAKDSYRQQLTYISDIWRNSALFGLERWVMLALAAVRLPLPSMVVNVIAAQLRIDPYAYSESRSTETDRILFFPPLGVAFEVSDADRMVTVYAVWQTTP